MKSTLLLAVLVFILAVVAGCKAPDTSTSGPKDSSSKAMKAAGSDEYRRRGLEVFVRKIGAVAEGELLEPARDHE